MIAHLLALVPMLVSLGLAACDIARTSGWERAALKLLSEAGHLPPQEARRRALGLLAARPKGWL